MEYTYLTERFGDSRPTGFDRRHGSFADAEPHAQWYVVLGQNRDSDALAKSNFECATSNLEACGEDAYHIHRFGHWGCGWYEVLIVNNENEKACEEADDMLRALADYPCLDDEHYSAKMCELEECECSCCPKEWCDCENCKKARGADEDDDDADIVLDEDTVSTLRVKNLERDCPCPACGQQCSLTSLQVLVGYKCDRCMYGDSNDPGY
jgi:hypothetical protein